MTYLLDTHAFLWYSQKDPSLSRTVEQLMQDASNLIYLSIASCWEISIKAGLGKLAIGEPSSTYITNALGWTGFDILPVSFDDAVAVEHLPHHHKDPFDRMLVAQANNLHIPILSADAILDAYGVTRIW